MSDKKEETKEAAPEETKDPNKVTLTIDGKEITVQKGINIIYAAKQVGVDIASFCYHPGLEVVAVCRQCLVSVEGSPKLVPACQGIVAEGMVVNTTDKDSYEARAQLLEYTLLNHPIDCPICDKSGECTLQNHYFEHSGQMSQSDVAKVNKPKRVDLGPTIVHDAERCILCTRCIRVCDEVAGVHQLEISNRGDHSVLGTAPGEKLDNPYSLNTVDCCPVGALTSKDFRFAMRSWELMSTPSICTGCSKGCNMEIHHKAGKTYRLIPRDNWNVNKYWMCDEGRMTYHSLTEKRLVGPLVAGMPSNWKKALEKAASTIQGALENGREKLGVIFSPHHSNEENYVLAKLAKETWQIEKLYIGGRTEEPDFADDILRKADRTPNRAGLQAILGEGNGQDLKALEADLIAGEITGLVIFGHELPMSDEALSVASSLDCLVMVTTHEVGLAKHAEVCLPAAAWAERAGTMTNEGGRNQKMSAAYAPVGQAKPAWEIFSDLARACDSTLQYENAQKVFEEMKKAVTEFSETNWGHDVLPIQLRFAHGRG